MAVSVMIQSRLSARLVKLLDEEIARQNQKSKSLVTRSSWVRWAIEMQLEISSQRRSVGKGKLKTRCHICDKLKPKEQIAIEQPSFLGASEYTCKSCASGKTSA